MIRFRHYLRELLNEKAVPVPTVSEFMELLELHLTRNYWKSQHSPRTLESPSTPLLVLLFQKFSLNVSEKRLTRLILPPSLTSFIGIGTSMMFCACRVVPLPTSTHFWNFLTTVFTIKLGRGSIIVSIVNGAYGSNIYRKNTCMETSINVSSSALSLL